MTSQPMPDASSAAASAPIPVVVAGALGRMGAEVVKAVFAAPDATLVHCQGTILFANPAAERVFADGAPLEQARDVLVEHQQRHQVDLVRDAVRPCGNDTLAREVAAVLPLLETQARWSRLPDRDTLLVERWQGRDGQHAFVFPFAGRLVHEGLAALVAWRMARAKPTTLTFACTDWGFELAGRDVEIQPRPAGAFALVIEGKNTTIRVRRIK
jgi:PAS domain-containing protein